MNAEQVMNLALVRACADKESERVVKYIVDKLAECHNHAITFTHGDLCQEHIMVNNGHVVAIVDWERAGWFPEYWEWVNAFTNCSFFRQEWGKPYHKACHIMKRKRRYIRCCALCF